VKPIDSVGAESFSLDELAQAARPTLFDAAARPELLVALIYANLMWPLLWDLLEKIRGRARAAMDTRGLGIKQPP